MTDESKLTVSISLVNTDLFEVTGFDDIVTELLSRVNQKKEIFFPVTVNNTYAGEFQIRLFSSTNNKPPQWLHFLKPLLVPQSPILSWKNLSHSYICFVGYRNEIFSISGGYAGRGISHYMIQEFGLGIIVRVFKKDSKVIKNIQDRGLTGNLLGQSKFYRGDQRFSDENQFGKIFKKVQAEVNKTILEKEFAFGQDDLRSASTCLAKESFRLSKSITFEKTLDIVKRLHEIWNRKPNFSINNVEHLSKRKSINKSLIERLEIAFIDNLYNKFKKGEDTDVDFCNKDFSKFFEADLFYIEISKDEKVKISSHSTLPEIIDQLKITKNYMDDGIEQFKYSVLYREVISESEGHTLTNASVLEHLHGEIVYEGKVYFRLDCEWYKVHSSFVKNLNKECEIIVNQFWDNNIIKEKFLKQEREGSFNRKFLNKLNWYVFDTITPDTIEFSDIMNYTDDAIHLFHVKKGFNNSVRDLTAQIRISATRVQEDMRNGFKYIKNVEKRTKRSKIDVLANQKFPEGGLSSLFDNKKPYQIIFTLVFCDLSLKNRSLKTNVEDFQSNIAKFSLIEVKESLNNMGFGFKIVQVDTA